MPLTPALDKSTISQASDDVRFGIAIAAFGQLVRGEATAPGFGWDEVMALATGARGADPFGYRAEAINLMRLAKSLPR